MRTGPYPNIVPYGDAVANDSDKTYVVPAGKQWRLQSLLATLVTTATVGNRQLDLLLTDGADSPVAKFVAGAVIAQSLTRSVLFAPGQPQETSFTAGLMLRCLADRFVLPAGYKVRVYDSAAIAAAADDLTVAILVEEMAE
jgi:hypothetical protein